MAQIIIGDLFKKPLGNVSDKRKLLISRITVIIITILCALVAMCIRKMGGSFKYLVTLLGMTTMPMFMPLLFGLYLRKIPGWGAILAFILGISTSVLVQFVLKLPLVWTIFTNGMVTFITLILTGLRPDVSNAAQIDEIFSRLKRPGSGNSEQPVKYTGSRSKILPLVSIAMFVLAITLGISFVVDKNTTITRPINLLSIFCFLAAGVVFWWIRKIIVIRQKKLDSENVSNATVL